MSKPEAFIHPCETEMIEEQKEEEKRAGARNEL